MDRPSMIEILRLSARARVKADPARGLLVGALVDFLILTGPYVRAGVSAPSMCAAFDEGITALMYVANEVQ